MAAAEVAQRIWEKIEHSTDEIICLSFARASGALDLSTVHANKIIDEFVDFGQRDKRITLANLKRIIAARTVKREQRLK